MNKHSATFADAIRARTALAGLGTGDLVRKTKIPASTYRKRMRDGTWTRSELVALNRVIHFEADDMKLFFEGK